MAGVGARHFYSIVVIDFIMSDVYKARWRTKPGESAREIATGRPRCCVRSRPEPRLGASAEAPVMIDPGFVVVLFLRLSGRRTTAVAE
jgi:hypothetical protein